MATILAYVGLIFAIFGGILMMVVWLKDRKLVEPKMSTIEELNVEQMKTSSQQLRKNTHLANIALALIMIGAVIFYISSYLPR